MAATLTVVVCSSRNSHILQKLKSSASHKLADVCPIKFFNGQRGDTHGGAVGTTFFSLCFNPQTILEYILPQWHL